MAKCSTALCQCRVDPFLFTVSFGIRLLLKKWLNTTESGKATLCSAMWTISYLWKETSSRIQSFVHWLLRGKDRKSEALTKAFYTSISIFTKTCGTHTHTHSESQGCTGSSTTAHSTGKEAHTKGSYGSASGFSGRPPAHLCGAWGSSASTTSLISTCQAASCCGWVQGMSGAMSRSHLKWQDENEGQGLTYGAD